MSRHLDVLRAEAAALVATARADLTATVPSCPAWDMTGLLGHTGVGYGWVTGIVRTRATAEVPYPEGAEGPREGVAEWFEDRLAELVAAVAEAGTDTPVWNWSERDFRVGWWVRRMANETAVHAWDARRATGEPAPVAPEVATDCVDESLTVFLPDALAGHPVAGLAGTFTVTCTDTSDSWHGELRPDRSEVRRGGTGDADATLRGTASDLALALWGRDVAVERLGDPRITGLLTE